MALTTNLIAYYKLSNTTDEIGGFTLTNNNTVAFSAGKIGDAADGSSSNSNKSLSSADNLGISSATAATSFSAWISVTTAPATNTAQTYLSHTTASTGYARQIIYEDAAGVKKLSFSMYGTTQTLISYNVTLTPGTWYHVVIVDDGTNGTLYLNAIAVAGPTTRATGTSATWNAKLNLLCRAVPDNYSSGLIDEVGVWTRALTASEVSILYNGGVGNQYTFLLPNREFLTFF